MIPIRFPLVAAAVLGGVLFVPSSARATSYDDWARGYGLAGEAGLPTANPDKDRYTNALEFAFDTNPVVAETNYRDAPALVEGDGGSVSFVYRINALTEGVARYQVFRSTDQKEWTAAPGTPALVAQDGLTNTYALPVDANVRRAFYRLEVAVPYTAAVGNPSGVTPLATDIGKGYWDLPVVDQIVLRTLPPAVSGNSSDVGKPDYSKYPKAAGAGLTAWTDAALADYTAANKVLPRRTWLGWFLWGNGVPPTGVAPGYPPLGNATDSTWSFNSFQTAVSGNQSTPGWRQVRLDQQPLYLSPLILNYAWPPAQFGYVTQPLAPIEKDNPGKFFYWGDKRMVRGVNVTQPMPYFFQYDNLRPGNPTDWQQLWLRCRTRPLETTVIVPGNLTPTQVLGNGTWSDIGVSNRQGLPRYQPFPYPVWDPSLTAAQQTPYGIKVDRIGSFDADLIWEGANPLSPDNLAPPSADVQALYAKNRYQRTAFNQPGRGNYLKMTVAQGSPFVWCETNGNRFVSFYNLIRANIAGQIDNTGNATVGSGAKTIPGQPVTSVSDVGYVLLYGDQCSPNQWFHDVPPEFPAITAPYTPGGFNPAGAQHNHTYTAIFYRKSSVVAPTFGSGGANSPASNGTDAQGNPYFFLEFTKSAKNWFVVGAVPPMRYYSGNVTVDGEPAREAAAHAWAQEMAKYAFNFVTSTKIDYAVQNISRVETTFSTTLVNPFVAAGDASAAGMTVSGNLTVLALSPHHYQPLTLGPDLTKASAPEVRWNPLVSPFGNFTVTAIPANANKNQASDPAGRWGYWTMRGNLKTIVAGQFKTAYPFQNFLPMMPAPDWDRPDFDLTGVQAVNVTSLGNGTYRSITTPPGVTIEQTTGSGATFTANVTAGGEVLGAVVTAGGTGFIDGVPAPCTRLVFDPPPSGIAADTARGFVEVSGNRVTQVLMEFNGKGYNPASPPNVTLQWVPGAGADLRATLDPKTGTVTTISVVDGGGGYPTGNPAPVLVKFDDPTAPAPPTGRSALATAQIDGSTGNNTGKILAVNLVDGGFGYSPTIQVTQGGNRTIDPPIIVPTFDAGGNMTLGPAQVFSAGSGFDFRGNPPPVATVYGTGDGATAQIISTGSLISVGPPTAGGLFTPGLYPSTGNLTQDLANITVEVPPPPGGGTPPTATITGTLASSTIVFAVTNCGGNYTTAPQAYFLDSDNKKIDCTVTVGGFNQISTVNLAPDQSPNLRAPATVVFSAGNAAAIAYPTFGIDPTKIALSGNQTANYATDVLISFRGGTLNTPTHRLPEIGFDYAPSSASPGAPLEIDATKLTVKTQATGWTYQAGGFARVMGGRGFDAELLPLVDVSKKIVGVQVISGGTNYPDATEQAVYAVARDATGTGAKFSVTVKDGVIQEVTVVDGGSNYSGPSIALSSNATNANPDPIGDNPKGPPAVIQFDSDGTGGIQNVRVLTQGKRYLAGTQTGPTPDSPSAFLDFTPSGSFPVAFANPPAANVKALVLPPKVSLKQITYDSILWNYVQNALKDNAPFGAGYEAAGGQDGYGLAEKFSATGRFTSDLFNFQSYLAGEGLDRPTFGPSQFALTKANTAAGAYSESAFYANSPLLSLRDGLKASVQGVQRSLTRLFDNQIATNSIGAQGDANDWPLAFFNLYDTDVGRSVVNPTTLLPTDGWVSSLVNPPQPGIGDQKGLAAWRLGRLWSGFGVSTQWNDQHYFFGYYLSAAGLAGMLDGSWLSSINGKPASLWAAPNQMGAAIDQWLMTVAYDAKLDSAFYKVPGFNFQEYAFFDRWNGHGWASGLSPGKSSAVLDSDVNTWSNLGTGSANYAGENENSAFEGAQAWAGAALWGAATDRKPVFDFGVYLLASNLAANDLYFLDKNYNLGVANNAYSWAPVTTIASSAVPVNGGNLNYPRGTDFVTGNPKPFWEAYPAFGGAASSGVSLLYKAGNEVDNFFLTYPFGSKEIEAFPATPWTLGIARNPTYMKKWAGAMMRREWATLKGRPGLYTYGDWIALGVTAALCGVPYLPGDEPFLPTDPAGTAPRLPESYTRLLSGWVTTSVGLGQNFALNSAYTPLSIINFLLALDDYGPPDWSYLPQATDGTGTPNDASILLTATFSKKVSVGGVDKVRTTFVAYNPGWQTRYLKFFRLAPDGSVGTQPYPQENPLTIPPKRLVTIPATFDITAE